MNTIEPFTRHQLEHLVGGRRRWRVSVYLPARPPGADVATERIRLRNLVSESRRQLAELGVRPVDGENLLEPLVALVDDTSVWSATTDAVAAFIDEEGSQVVRLGDVDLELAVVGDRFHVVPLLTDPTPPGGFAVLALSQGAVRLLRGDRWTFEEIDDPRLPATMAEVLRHDDREPQLQSHSAGRAGTGAVSAAFHGQGSARDHRDHDLDRFLRVVARSVGEVLGPSSPPLVLAGVDEIIARFRRVCPLDGLIDDTITGNPDHRTSSDLHRAAWALVGPAFGADRSERLSEIAARPTGVERTVRGALLAALDGRVDVAFVPVDTPVWGKLDGTNVRFHDLRLAGSEDLHDALAHEVLGHGGEVVGVASTDLGDDDVLVSLRY
jgi:hypothetical protein